VPEGDTIFRAARTLHLALAGRVVTAFESVLPQLTRVHDNTPVTGRTVESVTSVGKHLLIRFSGDLILRTHMRMSGTWHLYKPGERWQRPRSDFRVLVATDAYVAVAFNLPVAEFETSRSLARDEAMARLGPDLAADVFDTAAALARLRGRGDTPIADALLDQRVMSGIGNIFKSETLFVARVHPFALVSSLDDGTLTAVVDTARTLMRANVRDGAGGGIVTYTGWRRATSRADPSARLWVYGRQGQPCRRCGTPILSLKQGQDARTTYWCPACQPGDQEKSEDQK
jgi:endonuclease-8